MKLVIATCQFPIDGDIRRNLNFVRRQMRTASRRGAHVAHFPEGALSGYAGVEFPSFAGYDWALLERSTREVMALARELRLWVLLGSSHRLTGRHKPHNCVYVIDDRGRLAERYDKRFCTGNRLRPSHDLLHYSPGDHPGTFAVRGVPCGVLICHEMRYPELFREYRRLGVQVLFHSYHNGHATEAKRRKAWPLGVVVPATMQADAANNYFWISATNTSRRHSFWPGFLVRPDGIIVGRLPPHRAAVLVSTVDTRAKFKDASSSWRDRAMRGILHSGHLVSDPRSRARDRL